MRQVPAVSEPHAQDGVTGRHQGLVHGEVGVDTGVRLDVGVLGAEQPHRPLDGEPLQLVRDRRPAVESASRVALRGLVVEDRPQRLPHRCR